MMMVTFSMLEMLLASGLALVIGLVIGGWQLDIKGMARRAVGAAPKK